MGRDGSRLRAREHAGSTQPHPPTTGAIHSSRPGVPDRQGVAPSRAHFRPIWAIPGRAAAGLTEGRPAQPRGAAMPAGRAPSRSGTETTAGPPSVPRAAGLEVSGHGRPVRQRPAARRRPDDGRGIACARAQTIAERAHCGQIEPSGQPFIAHVRRVAAGVPAFACSVAWLHDVLEWTRVGELELAAAGLASDELAALRLLTRGPGEADDEAFLAEVRAIALAPGRPGAIARAVKRADMEDRALHPRHPGGRWRPPYDRARRLLAELSAPGLMAGPRRRGLHSAGEPRRDRELPDSGAGRSSCPRAARPDAIPHDAPARPLVSAETGAAGEVEAAAQPARGP